MTSEAWPVAELDPTFIAALGSVDDPIRPRADEAEQLHRLAGWGVTTLPDSGEYPGS